MEQLRPLGWSISLSVLQAIYRTYQISAVQNHEDVLMISSHEDDDDDDEDELPRQ